MTTTYKGYKITQCGSECFVIRLDGEHMDTVRGSLGCAHFCIDSNFEDLTPQPVDVYEGLELSEDVPTSEDLYLDPNFTVEGNDFVFNAHNDNNIDYTVKVTFDDVASFSENPVHVIKSHSEAAKEEIHDYCQQIIDRFQTGTTFYDVEITKKQPIDPLNYKCQGRKYKVLKQLSPYFGKTMKEVSILSKQGKIKGVCFEVLKSGEWHTISFLFSELEEIK